MKKYTSLFAYLPLLLICLASCTNSHEDDAIYYIPKQVNESLKDKENAAKAIIHNLTYDKLGRVITEATEMEAATIYYNKTDIGSIESVQFVKSDKAKEQEREDAVKKDPSIKKESVAVIDSVKAVYTYTASSIDIALKTYRKGKEKEPEISNARITLNARQLPLTYINGNAEQRYSYDSEGRLTAIEWYAGGTLSKRQAYSYSGIKSAYSEVQHYPAWYFVAYRSISPVELPIKATVEEKGTLRTEYELSEPAISDLGFVTKCTKTGYDSSGKATAYLLRYEFGTAVFD